MKPSNFAAQVVRAAADFSIENVRVASFAEGSPFAGKGYQADTYTAYVEFDICHTLPGVWLGPLSNSGEFMGFIGETLMASHRSLRHKQFNYRHQLAAYGTKDKPKKDHIIGAIVDTHMDDAPPEGWWSPSNPEGAQTCIKVCAALFKQAESVGDILAKHLDDTVKQSVSIEVIDRAGNLRLYRPSTNEMVDYASIPEDWASAITFKAGQKRPVAGKLNGEQLIVIYGAGGEPVQFQGVGMTANPAERFAGTATPAAEITSVLAENELCAVAAEVVPTLIVGRVMRFDTGRSGVISRVATSGRVGIHAASEANPVCEVRVGGRVVSVPFADALEKIL